jgi:hypothetical protein
MLTSKSPWLSHDQVIDAEMPGASRHGQTIRAGPDDKQVGRFLHVLGVSVLRPVFLSSRVPTAYSRAMAKFLTPHKPFSSV